MKSTNCSPLTSLCKSLWLCSPKSLGQDCCHLCSRHVLSDHWCTAKHSSWTLGKQIPLGIPELLFSLEYTRSAEWKVRMEQIKTVSVPTVHVILTSCGLHVNVAGSSKVNTRVWRPKPWFRFTRRDAAWQHHGSEVARCEKVRLKRREMNVKLSLRCRQGCQWLSRAWPRGWARALCQTGALSPLAKWSSEAQSPQHHSGGVPSRNASQMSVNLE